MEQNLRTKRIVKGTLAAASEQVVSIVVQLVMLPLFISKWGVSLYGEWLLLFTFPSYLTMSDFGFAKVAVNSMTLNYAVNNTKKVNEYYQSCFVLISIISLIVVALALIIPALLPLKDILNLSLVSSGQVFWVLFSLTIYVLLTQQCELLAGIFASAGFFTIGILYATLYRFLEFLVLAIALLFNADIVILALCYTCVRFIKLANLYIHIRVKFKWMHFGFSATKKNASVLHIKEMLKPALAFMLLPFGNALRNQLPIFLLGIFVTPVSIVVFSTLRTIVNMGSQFIGLITKALTPEYAIAYAKEDYTTLKSIYYKSSNISFWMSILLSIGILLFSNILLKVWVHNKIQINYYVLGFFLLSLVANSIWTTASFLSYSINKHTKQSIYFMISCIVSSIITFFLVKNTGLNFSVIGILFADILMCTCVIKINGNILNDNPHHYIFNLITPPIFIVKNLYNKL